MVSLRALLSCSEAAAGAETASAAFMLLEREDAEPVSGTSPRRSKVLCHASFPWISATGVTFLRREVLVGSDGIVGWSKASVGARWRDFGKSFVPVAISSSVGYLRLVDHNLETLTVIFTSLTENRRRADTEWHPISAGESNVRVKSRPVQ